MSRSHAAFARSIEGSKAIHVGTRVVSNGSGLSGLLAAPLPPGCGDDGFAFMGRLSCLMSNLLTEDVQVLDSSAAVRRSLPGRTRRRAVLGGRGHEAILPPAPAKSTDAVGAWLADAAHDEAASVVAFKAVARELEVHRAPHSLPMRARAAAQDEVRHAAMMESMAMRWGVHPERPKLASIAVRSLEAVALENAMEGCVRETWTALEACYQARWAKDPLIRRAMLEISLDELRHAEFSWALDGWARRQLDDKARARVDAARRTAAEELLESLSSERDRNLCIEAGMPPAETAQSLASQLHRALWN